MDGNPTADRGPALMVEPLAVTLVIFIVGFTVFNRLARQIAENL